MTESIGSLQRGWLVACVAATAIAAPVLADDVKRPANARGQMLEKFDSDGDGKLSPSERKTARESRRTGHQSRMHEKFDTDGDGVLSAEEQKAFDESDFGKHRAKMLEEFDADGDGEISDDERQAARAAHQKRGGRRGGHGERPPGGGGPPDAGDPSPR